MKNINLQKIADIQMEIFVFVSGDFLVDVCIVNRGQNADQKKWKVDHRIGYVHGIIIGKWAVSFFGVLLRLTPFPPPLHQIGYVHGIIICCQVAAPKAVRHLQHSLNPSRLDFRNYMSRKRLMTLDMFMGL